MTNVLFAGGGARWAEYEAPLRIALRDLDVTLSTDLRPETVDYIVYAPNGPVTDFTPFTQLKAVLNLWAGVENVTGNPTLTVPLCRMVDPSLKLGMVEWVTGHVLRRHLNMDDFKQDGVWRSDPPPLASDRRVVILGLGELGCACAKALTQLNFQVHGWSRNRKDIDGVIWHDSIDDALRLADILVLLLPLTPQTEGVMNTSRMALMPKDAQIINPGRGGLIVDDDLTDALKDGHITHATLDVFRQEPLPPDHLFWGHPRITVTPHIASATRPCTASQVIAENIRRGEAGLSFLHVVDRNAGY